MSARVSHTEYMNKHEYRIPNPTGGTVYGTQKALSHLGFTEADRKGLVEHSEYCWCVSDAGSPPF